MSSSAQESEWSCVHVLKVVGARFHFHCGRFQPGFLLDVSVGYVVGSPGHLCARSGDGYPEGLECKHTTPTNMEKERSWSVKQSFEMLVFQHVCGRMWDVSPRLTLTMEAKSMGLGTAEGSFTHTRVYPCFLTP